MKITERKLRSIIRSVIKENIENVSEDKKFTLVFNDLDNDKENFNEKIFDYCVNDAKKFKTIEGYWDNEWDRFDGPATEVKNILREKGYYRDDNPGLPRCKITFKVDRMAKSGILTWLFKFDKVLDINNNVEDVIENPLLKVELIEKFGEYSLRCSTVTEME